jgi:hypothetical protein
LAIAPMRRGPARGSTHVAIIKNRKSHPDNANQRKKIVYKKKQNKKNKKVEWANKKKKVCITNIQNTYKEKTINTY